MSCGWPRSISNRQREGEAGGGGGSSSSTVSGKLTFQDTLGEGKANSPFFPYLLTPQHVNVPWPHCEWCSLGNAVFLFILISVMHYGEGYQNTGACV